MSSQRPLSLIAVVLLCAVTASTMGKSPDDRLAWWQDARFGMFIHWGVYAVPARGAWILYQEHMQCQGQTMGPILKHKKKTI